MTIQSNIILLWSMFRADRATNGLETCSNPLQWDDNRRCRIFLLTRVTRIFQKSVFTEIAS